MFEYDGGLPSSTQWNGGVQMTLPWATALDVEYVGQHSYNTLEEREHQRDRFRGGVPAAEPGPDAGASATPGATAVLDRSDARRSAATAASTSSSGRGWSTYHSLQFSFKRRFSNGVSFGFNDTIGLYDHQSTGARLQHNADGIVPYRADQAEADELLGRRQPGRAHDEGELRVGPAGPQERRSALRAIGLVVNDWQLSGIWTAATGAAPTPSASATRTAAAT